MEPESKPNVGGQLRSFREQQGYSLRALSERCGLSINAISRIERGENSPTVSSLSRLANALAIPITDFFLESDKKTALLIPKGNGQHFQKEGYEIEHLAVKGTNKELEPLLISIAPESGPTIRPLEHAGEEFIYCLTGQVEVCVGDEIYRLNTGDSLLFDATQSHYCNNAGEEPATLLLIFHAGPDRYIARQQHISFVSNYK